MRCFDRCKPKEVKMLTRFRPYVVLGSIGLMVLALVACGTQVLPTPTQVPPTPTESMAATEMQAGTMETTEMATESMETTEMPAGTMEATEAGTMAPMTAADVIVTPNATLGDILTDSHGMTLYVFTKDTAGTSTCMGACLTNWPAFTIDSSATPVASEGVTAKLGTIVRSDDGTTQITVNGMPVYYYAKDAKAGDTAGQGVNSVWYVLDAAGNMIEK
jgi:predicted lipoprotein with Yx(FWY)xxD motif